LQPGKPLVFRFRTNGAEIGSRQQFSGGNSSQTRLFRILNNFAKECGALILL